jgi:hypothetical protein
MRERREAQNEFYKTQDSEERENDKKVPAFFRKHGNEPSSSDPKFDDNQGEDAGAPRKRISKKAEDMIAW